MKRRLHATRVLFGRVLPILLIIMARSASAQLTFPGTISGSLGGFASQNYSFTVPADGSASFAIWTNAGYGCRVFFIDSDGQTARSQIDASPSKTTTMVVPHLGPGTTYYLDVYMLQDGGSYTVTSSFVPEAGHNDLEPNDTTSTAQVSLAARGGAPGHLGFSRTSYLDQDEADCYKFTPPADGDLTVTVLPSSTLATRTYLIDTDGVTNLGYVDGSRGKQSTITLPHVGKSGTYFVMVTCGNFSQGDNVYGHYTLKTSFAKQIYSADKEPNNTLATASPLSTSGTTASHLGYSLTSFNDRDITHYYHFAIKAAGTVSYNLTLTSDLAVRCFVEDASGNSHGQWDIAQGGTATISVNLPSAGTYYLVLTLLPTGPTFWGAYLITNE